MEGYQLLKVGDLVRDKLNITATDSYGLGVVVAVDSRTLLGEAPRGCTRTAVKVPQVALTKIFPVNVTTFTLTSSREQ